MGVEDAWGFPNKCFVPVFCINKPKAIVTNEIYNVTVGTSLDANRMARRLKGKSKKVRGGSEGILLLASILLTLLPT
jgi:hypothetical protein